MSENNFEDFEKQLNATDGEPKESAEKTEEATPIGSDIIRGHINTIILRALYEGDKYGYEIMNDIEVKSHGQYSLKQPTLYSALKRLENQGYIKAYWKTDEVSSGGRRKYFTLTDSGREITEKNLAEWEYSRTIIDSLISDRSFDFSNPAPTPVDFHILKNSVSRVPVVKYEDTEKEEKSTDGAATETEKSLQGNQENAEAYQHIIVEQQVEQPIVQQTVVERTDIEQTKNITSPVQQQQETFIGQVQSEQPAPQRVNAEDEARKLFETYF